MPCHIECGHKGIQQCIGAFGVRVLHMAVLIPSEPAVGSVCENEERDRGCEISHGPPDVCFHLHLITIVTLGDSTPP
jgi:hypothetical protein